MAELESLERRLLAAESPNRINDWHKRESYYTRHCQIAETDIPLLLAIANRWADPEWPSEVEPDLDAERFELLPVTAWRALGELGSEESIAGLIELMCEASGNSDDDWTPSEMPCVFAKFGIAAIPALAQVAKNDTLPEMPRMIAVECLDEIAKQHEVGRPEVFSILTALIEAPRQNHPFMNGIIVGCLAEHQVLSAAEAIERAFADGQVDRIVAGDWEMVRNQLGVTGLGLEMPASPVGSFPSNRYVGVENNGNEHCVSEHDDTRDDELTDEQQADYLKQTTQAFAQSPEGQCVIDRLGACSWIDSLLNFGLSYRGEIDKEMDVDSIEDFLFDYAPRKMVVEADCAADIVFELLRFWEFQEREHQHPQAASIIRYLLSSGIDLEFQRALAEPDNYGPAKSLFMDGLAAGYDMSCEEGISQYVDACTDAFLRARPGRFPPTMVSPPPLVDPYEQPLEPIRIDDVRIGRNEPCPCGSGKKYKKCCHN